MPTQGSRKRDLSRLARSAQSCSRRHHSSGRRAERDGRTLRDVYMLALTLAAAAAAGPKGFTVTDAILGSGPDALNMTVLANRDTGEKFGIVSLAMKKMDLFVGAIRKFSAESRRVKLKVVSMS